jgi:hypothetical protein
MTRRLVVKQCLPADGPMTAERVSALVVAFADRTRFDEFGTLSLYREGGSEIRSKHRLNWGDIIRSEWDMTARLVCVDYGLSPAPRIEVDRRTGLVHVELPHEDDEAPDAGFAALKILPVDHDVYRYRKTAATYEAADWDTRRFANPLAAVADNLTGGSRPQVMEAYYQYQHRQAKNVERLRGFFDVASLVDSLIKFSETDARSADLQYVGLGLRGPAEIANGEPVGRAIGIGVRVAPLPIQVTFRSSLTPDALARTVAPLRDAIDLGDRAVAARFEGAGTGSAVAKTEDRTWFKYLAVPVLAALATTIVSTPMLQAVLAGRQIELYAPVANGGTYAMKPGKLEVKWFSRRTNDLWQSQDFDVPATVDVVRNGSVITSEAGRSSAALVLGTGDYTIVVRADGNYDPVRFTVNAVP